jgi:hypothetical protein
MVFIQAKEVNGSLAGREIYLQIPCSVFNAGAFSCSVLMYGKEEGFTRIPFI